TSMPAERKAQMAKMAPNGVMRSVVATLDDLGLIAIGPDSQASAERAIDAARGKAAHFTPTADVAALLAASRARKDSIAMVMDFGAMASMMGKLTTIGAGSHPLLMSFGFADGSAHMRITVPSATMRAMAPTP